MITIRGRKLISTNTHYPGTRPLVIVFWGESNSGGEALNSDATTDEKLPRSAVQILNNNSNLFEDLHIGVNNNLDHFGLDPALYHGWELQLAARVEANAFPGRPVVYLIKRGQGGSGISEWSPSNPNNYYNKLIASIETAIATLTNPLIVGFYSQGINDMGGTTPTSWGTQTEAHFAQVRGDLSLPLPIIQPYFNMPGRTMYNLQMGIMQADVTRYFNTSSMGAALQDGNHWSYLGNKLVADNMINKLLGII